MVGHPVAVHRDGQVDPVGHEEVPPARMIGHEEDAGRVVVERRSEWSEPLGEDAVEVLLQLPLDHRVDESGRPAALVGGDDLRHG